MSENRRSKIKNANRETGGGKDSRTEIGGAHGTAAEVVSDSGGVTEKAPHMFHDPETTAWD